MESVINNFKLCTENKFNKIDKMTAYEIEEIVKNRIEDMIEISDFDVELVDMAIYGSRCRGIEHKDSDLDIVFEYKGSEREDDVFNLLHSEDFTIGGIPIDINPIRKEESGTLSNYLLTAEEYLQKKKRTQNIIEAQSKEFIKVFAKEVYHKSHSLCSIYDEKSFINEMLERAKRDGDLPIISFLKDTLENIKAKEKDKKIIM